MSGGGARAGTTLLPRRTPTDDACRAPFEAVPIVAGLVVGAIVALLAIVQVVAITRRGFEDDDTARRPDESRPPTAPPTTGPLTA